MSPENGDRRRRGPHHRVHRALLSLSAEWATIVFLFWCSQAIGWLGMMVYIQFFPNRLKDSILYTDQISHWALVLSCLVGAGSMVTVVVAKHAHRRIERELDVVERLEQGERHAGG